MVFVGGPWKDGIHKSGTGSKDGAHISGTVSKGDTHKSGTGSKDGTHILGTVSKVGAHILGTGSKGGTQIGFDISSSPQDIKGPKAIKLTTNKNAIKIVLKVVFIFPPLSGWQAPFSIRIR